VVIAWSLVIGGITTLLVAANRKQKEHLCRKVVVGFKGAGEKFYIDKNDVLKQLEKTTGGSLINKPTTRINLASLEKALEANQWIKDAQLYIDREDVLHVSVEEREPIARIFTTLGASFYMDSSGHQMPLIEKLSARVPVITGYTNPKVLSAKDSALLNDVKHIAQFINSNEFWNAQIGQVDITADRKFELIPVIGDHIIRIGDAENLEEKLNNLLLFYKQVMSKTGFNKYSVVDVQFNGQVIGVHKGITSAVDSIQLQKNIEELLKKSTIQNVSDDMLPDNEAAKSDSIHKTNPIPSIIGDSAKNNPIQPDTGAKRKSTTSSPVTIRGKEKPTKEVKTIQRPKAVMQRRK
jgi:cell division protein FtsQ